MNARIEHADPLALLCELPTGWAQSCVTSPPLDGTPSATLAVLDEVRRVLRHDGTLWLLAQRRQPLLAALRGQGWLLQPAPAWSRPRAAGWGGSTALALLTNQPCYFHEEQRPARSSLPPRAAVVRQSRRAEACRCGREHRGALLRRCVLAGSSPLACGICGAPFRRATPGSQTMVSREPTCQHNDPGGRCLLLDPFYTPVAGTAELAVRYGRSFLGINAAAEVRWGR